MATASPTSTAHIRKRPYQPSITSFFNTRDTGVQNPSSLQRCASSLSPALPEDTQASLLSVGMRVRKSVPEGYKTHKTLGTQGFSYPSTAPPDLQHHTGTPSALVGTRELMPFCGLHKTGGWAMQEMPASSAPAAMQRDDDNDDEGISPGLTLSQSTVSSTQSSLLNSSSALATNSRKRTYEEEIEAEMDAYFGGLDGTDYSIRAGNQVDSRPRARPRSTLRKSPVIGSVPIAGGADFEEASFLAPMDVEDPA